MSNQKNIIFGTGPLGLLVMQTLAEKGAQVTLVNRKGGIEQKLPKQVEIVAGDATDSSIVHQICKEADAVFHCAMPPYTEWPDKFPPLTKGVLEGVSRAGAKLIYGDNLYMYGDTEGRPISEDLPYAATGHKGKVRAEMAEMLLNAHKKEAVQVVIGRGSDFYGPQVVNSAFGEMFFKAALSGKPANLLGNIDLPHTYTYIKDFAKALVKLSENDKALGQIWHVPNASTITTRQLVELVEKEIGQSIKIRAAGRLMVTLLGLFNPMIKEVKEMMYEWEHPYIVDHSKFEQTFGADVTPHEVAIKETVAWYRQRIGSN
jgi:nucleoside-diphosphate-sugar epimerase